MHPTKNNMDVDVDVDVDEERYYQILSTFIPTQRCYGSKQPRVTFKL
jgi:hypothetical protein